MIFITIYMGQEIQEMSCLHPSILEFEKNEKVFTERI